jgi:hypothetical protein
MKNKIPKKRKILLEKAIKLTEIEDQYKLLPAKAKEIVSSFSWPQISINIDQSKSFSEINSVEQNIKDALSSRKIVIKNGEMPLSEIYWIFGLNNIFKSLKAEALINLGILKREKITKNVDFYTNLHDVSSKLSTAIENTLAEIHIEYFHKVFEVIFQEVFKHFYFDKESIYPCFEFCETAGHKRYPQVTIKKFSPDKRVFSIEGKPRNAYGCYHFGPSDVFPITLKENTVNNIKPAAVYIQDHAINRMVERLKITPSGYMFESVSRSLINPVVSGRDGESYLVDYYYANQKMGYLVVHPVSDILLIRSFKFITMSGTPEFYRLKRELRGDRQDFEYLGLDTVDGLMNSDLHKDPKLRQIFKNCGLSHLFEFSKNVRFDNPKSLIAEEIKKYFQIDK